MGRQDAGQKTNWETRCKMKKKWGDETRQKKDRETRCETKKMGK